MITNTQIKEWIDAMSPDEVKATLHTLAADTIWEIELGSIEELQKHVDSVRAITLLDNREEESNAEEAAQEENE